MKANVRHLLFVIVLGVLAAPGCGPLRDVSIFSTAQEVELGRSYADQLEQEMTLLNDPIVVNYVREVGARVAVHAQRQDVEYQFDVVLADDINAFAVPGGWIYIFTGLLKEMQSESELAAVLAHEVAHIAKRHSMVAITRQVGFSVLVAALLGDDAAAWQTALANVGGTLTFLSFSRDDERESDALGLQYLYAAGYDPHGMVDLLSLFVRMSDREPSRIEQWLSTHPGSAERVGIVREMIEEQNLSGGEVGRERYRDIMRRLP